MSIVDKPLRVAALGIEGASLAALEMAFQGERANWCQLTDEAHAQVVILDGDRVGALTLFDEQRRRYPDRPVLVLSVREVRLKQAIPIRKPAKLDHLLAGLRKAQQQLIRPMRPMAPTSRREAARSPRRSTPTGEGPNGKVAKPSTPESSPPPQHQDSPPHSTRTAADALQTEKLHELSGQAQDFNFAGEPYPEEAFFNPAEHLQGQLVKAAHLAREDQTAVQVMTLYEPIILLPEQRAAAVPIVERRLRALSVMPTRTRPFTTLGPMDSRRVIANLPDDCMMPMENLIWKVTLWSARGRLPLGTDPFAPVRLRHWPNLTRLPLIPHSLRIAALWHRHPCSPLDTATRLGIPQRYVFALYSACQALEMLESDHRSETKAQAEAPEKRSFLQKLLTALRRAA